MNNLSYTEQIQREINKARKGIILYALDEKSQENNSVCELKIKYYTERLSYSACVSYEIFVKSWAGKNWINDQIEKDYWNEKL